jgi:hypothetical protein
VIGTGVAALGRSFSGGIVSSSLALFDTFFSGSVGNRSIARLTGLPGLSAPFLGVPNRALAGLRFAGLVVGVRCVGVPVFLLLLGVPNGGLKPASFVGLRVLLVGVSGVVITGLACFSGLLFLVGVVSAVSWYRAASSLTVGVFVGVPVPGVETLLPGVPFFFGVILLTGNSIEK